ncbi:MAG: alpha/beta hydrolase [Actinomycetota bacterium]|nr:alpha/beta hydrolase [Actinomycetota bacterium]
MAPIADGAGVPLSYAEQGDGAAVLLVHGLASDAAALAPLGAALAEAGTRVIAYDRRGYGASGAPRPYGGTTVEEQAEDAAALLDAVAGEPALVVGEGFGALIALDLVRRHGRLVRAVVASDPPLFMLVPAATAELSEQRGEIEEAVRTGGPEAGVEVWLGGRVDGAALARARASFRGFFADYAGLASWSVTRPELRRLGAPAVVVTGPFSPPHVLAAADELAALLPDARRSDDGDLVAAARKLL